MGNRFYFRQFQIAEAPKKAGEKPTIEEVQDSIDLENINRTRQYKDGTMIILLKDGHEETKEVSIRNKAGEIVKRNERVWVHSEIRLEPSDATRFKIITEYYDYSTTLVEQGVDLEVEPLTKTQLDQEQNIVPDFANPEITESREEAEQEAIRDKEENN